MRSAKRLLQQCRPLGTQLEEVVGLGGACIAPWWPAGVGRGRVGASAVEWAALCAETTRPHSHGVLQGIQTARGRLRAGEGAALPQRRPWTAAAAAGQGAASRSKP